MKLFALMLPLLVMTALPAQAGDAPPMSEYDHVPQGILLDAAQRTRAPVDEAAAPVPSVDPQVPVHSVEGLAPAKPDTVIAPRLQTLDQIKAAYAAGRHKEAVTPLELLVAQNDAEAMLLLGIMLENGEGIPADPARAATLLQQAAETDLPLAQHRLAILYYQGKGVAKDDVRAMMWLHVAAAKYPPGPERDRALADRRNLGAALTRRDRDTAQLLAREWLEKRGEAHLLQPQE